MRVSVPTIPQAILSKAVQAQAIPRAAAIERVAQFLTPGNVAILTGAGVSVDSGIRAYRGKDGRYMNPNYKCVHSGIRCNKTELVLMVGKANTSASHKPIAEITPSSLESTMNSSAKPRTDKHSGQCKFTRRSSCLRLIPRRQRYW